MPFAQGRLSQHCGNLDRYHPRRLGHRNQFAAICPQHSRFDQVYPAKPAAPCGRDFRWILGAACRICRHYSACRFWQPSFPQLGYRLDIHLRLSNHRHILATAGADQTPLGSSGSIIPAVGLPSGQITAPDNPQAKTSLIILKRTIDWFFIGHYVFCHHIILAAPTLSGCAARQTRKNRPPATCPDTAAHLQQEPRASSQPGCFLHAPVNCPSHGDTASSAPPRGQRGSVWPAASWLFRASTPPPHPAGQRPGCSPVRCWHQSLRSV